MALWSSVAMMYLSIHLGIFITDTSHTRVRSGRGQMAVIMKNAYRDVFQKAMRVFEVPTGMAVKYMVFWDMMPCILVDRYLQTFRMILLPSSSGQNMFLRNVGSYLPTTRHHIPGGRNLNRRRHGASPSFGTVFPAQLYVLMILSTMSRWNSVQWSG
jgi:hypothetical protein